VSLRRHKIPRDSSSNAGFHYKNERGSSYSLQLQLVDTIHSLITSPLPSSFNSTTYNIAMSEDRRRNLDQIDGDVADDLIDSDEDENDAAGGSQLQRRARLLEQRAAKRRRQQRQDDVVLAGDDNDYRTIEGM
jgi:hypothetical protein